MNATDTNEITVWIDDPHGLADALAVAELPTIEDNPSLRQEFIAVLREEVDEEPGPAVISASWREMCWLADCLTMEAERLKEALFLDSPDRDYLHAAAVNEWREQVLEQL